MERRSFLTSLISAGLTAVGSVSLREVNEQSQTVEREATATSYWDSLRREEKMLRLAERVVPGTDLESLTLTLSDFNGAASAYEQYQSDPTDTPLMHWLNKQDISVTADDVAVSAYVRTDQDTTGLSYPRYIDSAAIAIPDGNAESLITAVKDWEDQARSSGTTNNLTTGESTLNRGLSRYVRGTDSGGYRVQRLRVFDDRLLVHWTEGVPTDEQHSLPLAIIEQFEEELLLRRVRAYLDAGHSIPDEPIFHSRSRWR